MNIVIACNDDAIDNEESIGGLAAFCSRVRVKNEKSEQRAAAPLLVVALLFAQTNNDERDNMTTKQ